MHYGIMLPTFVLALAFVAPARALTPAPPPSPPFGWEDRVAPGYTPSVESVVVRLGRFELREPAERETVWASWDAGAVDVLVRIIGDPAWKEFRGGAVQLLAVSPHDAAKAWLNATADALAQKSDATTEDINLFYATVGAATPERQASWIDPFLEHGAAHARQWALGQLLGAHTPESFARAEEAIDAETDDATRKRWQSWLDESRGYIRAQEPMEGAR